MTSLKLRQYQQECLECIHDHYAKGVSRQLVSLPTAAGKTVIFAHLINEMKRKTLVLAHTTELLDQAKEKIQMICPNVDVGLVKAGCKEFDRSVIVFTIQSARQPETLEEFKRQGFSLCIYDEAHRSASRTPREVLYELGFFNTTRNLLVGFSATPFRNYGRGLGEIFEELTYRKTINELIKLGYLCKPLGVKIKPDLDLSTVQIENGDFKTESLASYMNTPEMIELTVETWLEKAFERKRTVAFGVNVTHAKNLSEAFKKRGISSAVIHGEMDQNERTDLLERFKSGSISILANCQILTEGWDCPEVDCVLVAKPTMSKGLFIQMAGRGLRLFPNKRDCLILDFGSKRHSLCSTAILNEDAEEEESKCQKSEGKSISEFIKNLPPNINKKLKAAIMEFDLLGDDFFWIQDGNTFTLRGIQDSCLKILPTSEKRFSVLYFQKNAFQMIAEGLNFDYAFSAAEDFARENRALFVVCDLEAEWRQKPISQKQQELFRSFGYRAGIEELSRGQAALIIGSGVLNKKSRQTVV